MLISVHIVAICQTAQAHPSSGPPIKWLLIGEAKTATMATSCLAIPLMEEVEGGDIGLQVYTFRHTHTSKHLCGA